MRESGLRAGRLGVLARATAVAAVIAVSSVPVPAAAAAGSGTVLAVGQSTQLPPADLGVRVPLVGDPRLNGYDYDAQVWASTCTATHAGTGTGEVVAPSGGELCVFVVHVHPEDQEFLTNQVSAPAFTVESGTTSVPITVPALFDGDSQGAFAVAVRKGAPARLAASQTVPEGKGAFTVAFDLRHRTRLGPNLPALYRATQASCLTAPPSTVTATSKATRSDTHQTVVFSWGLRLAALSLFAPLNEPTRVGDDQGYLIVGVDLTPTTASGASLSEVTPPVGLFHLRLPNGTVLPAAGRVLAVAGDKPGDVLDADYYFKVPATFTTATIQITPGVLPAGAGQLAPTPLRLTFTGATATLPVRLPDQAPLHQSPDQAYEQTTPVESPAARPSGGEGTAWAVVLIVLLVVAIGAGVGVWAWRARRRVWLPARPVTRTSQALLAATPSELSGLRVLGELAPPPASPPGPFADPGGEDDEELGIAGEPLTGLAVEATEGPVGHAAPPAVGPEPEVPVLVVRVLGPLQVEGLAGPIRRSAVRRLLVALALSDGPVGVEGLRDLIATDPDRPVPADQVHSFASKLRALLPPGVLPPIGPGAGGYQLAGNVEVDWAVFERLAARAALVDGPDRLELASRALGLVRGVPLALGSWEGVEARLRQVTTRIEAVAADTARLALSLRDARSAEQAVTQGLLAVEQSPVLWELRLVAAAAGSGVGLHRAWEHTQTVLGPDAQALQDTFERLRTGQY